MKGFIYRGRRIRSVSIFGLGRSGVGVLKFIDRLLGAVFNVAVVWAIFGIVFAVSNAGTEWLVAIDEQLASSGMNLRLAQIAGDVFSHINSSEILKMVYEAFNPVGELVGGMLFA